jgi:uncharacterized protein
MQAAQVGMLLRVFIGEADREGIHGLDGVIVEAARAAGLAGATVLHGPLGFGASRRTNSDFIVEAPGNLPVVVEIVDTEPRVNAFLPTLDRLVGSGLVTLEEVRMFRCGSKTGGVAGNPDRDSAAAP